MYSPLTPKDADRYDGTGPVTIRDDQNRPNTPAIATTADARRPKPLPNGQGWDLLAVTVTTAK